MKKFLTVFLLAVLALIFLVLGFLWVVGTTSWGQQFVTRQVNNYLAGKIKSPFRIGRITYDIPDYIGLEDVLFITPQGDTLLAGQRLRVDLDMMGLLKNRVALNQIELENVRVNLRRTLPDTTFNFQYLIDAFDTGGPPQPVDTTAAPMDISLSRVILKKVGIRYKDDVAGADVNAYLDSLRANFDETDVAKSQYHLRTVNVDGLVAKTRLYQGIDTPETPDTSAPGDTLDLKLGSWTINRARWDVQVETADFQTKGSVGRLAMESDYFYLDGQRIGIKSVELENGDIAAVLTKATKKANSVTPAELETTEESGGWRASVGRVALAKNRIRFDDQNQPKQKTGLDYGHLDLQNFSITAQSIQYTPQLIAGKFRGGQFRDQSGFALQRLDADVIYSDTLTSVNRLYVQTPQTLLRDQLILRYDSIGQLSRPREAGRVGIRVNLRQSRLAVADILQLAPFLANTAPFAGNRQAVIRVNTLMRGTLANLSIPTFELDMLSGTRLRASGRLRNVTDVDRLAMDITLTEGSTQLRDIRQLVPKGTLPDSFNIPPKLRLTGRFQGELDNLNLNSALQTDWGNVEFDGNVRGFVAGKNQAYRGTLSLARLEAGRWLGQQGTIGTITADATVDGRGIDVKTMQTVFRVNVRQAELMDYNYQNFTAEGRLDQGILNVESTLDDPNAKLALNSRVGLLEEFPSIRGSLAIDKLDVTQLKFYKDPLSVQGQLRFDFASTDPTKPIGTLVARETVVRLNGKTYPLDSFYVKTNAEGVRKIVEARLPFARMNLDGQFDYTRLYDIAASEFSKYIQLPDLTYNPVNPPYSFNVNMEVNQHPLLAAFVPALTRMDPVTFRAYVDNVRDTTFAAFLKTGLIEYDSMQVQGVTMNLAGVNERLGITGRINAANASGIRLNVTKLNAEAIKNRLWFEIESDDSTGRAWYGLSGNLAIADRAYQFRFNPDGLLTNYQRWTSDTTGYIQYSEEGILAENFLLQTQSGETRSGETRSGETRSGQTRPQKILVNSIVQQPNAPLEVKMENIDLTNMARLANQDTTLVGGVLNGDVVLRNVLTNLSFTGNVGVDSLKVMAKPLGNLTAQFENTTEQRISTDIALIGSGNRARVTGFYKASDPANALDFKVNLEELSAQTIEAFSFGQLRQTSGSLHGQMDVTGSTTAPRINGAMSFDSLAFNVAYLNATYHIDNETIRFDEKTITFQDFSVRDALNRSLTTNGTITLRELPDVSYNLRVKASKFQVLNATRKDNELAYGTAAISADLGIRGSGTSPTITGSIKLEDESNVTLVLPDESASVNEAREIVTFIDHRDTLALRKYLVRVKPDTTLPRLEFRDLSKSQIDLSLEANEKSEITVIVDPLNGDNLRIRGNARLNVGISQSGAISLLGRYDVTEGEYSLTYEVLKRKFSIQKGSYITWTGDPLRAQLDITALYQTTATPANLIANETSQQLRTAAKQKIPFNVLLKMKGQLASPDISFDIAMPEEDFLASRTIIDAVNSKLTQLRQDPSQLNKQVFGLMVLGSFIAENTSSSSGGGINTEEIARSSVSKILSDQLEKFASSLLKGFDVNFDLLSSSQSAGANNSVGSRTDLNVDVSRSFLQGRLTVSVGRNFVLENNTGINRNPNEVFDNLSLNYNLTRDGRYMLRGYRKSDYQAVLEGYVIETGVGFVITVDYNLLSEIFRKSAENKEQ
ncbi:translocation/assembly module TamB domain-containing protein [Larkinella sp. VNQ87]|uniref:translocation/assembly module TamB domain-containing protein n=1 Tax=Larkinella sp. VNQ87 TaxID=3400921 RepID=UPI003C00E7B8